MTNMQWGLIPHWMKRQPDHATALKTINARDDTIVYVECVEILVAILRFNLVLCLCRLVKAVPCGKASEAASDA